MNALPQASIGFLRVMGWLILVGTGIFFAVDIVNAANAPDAIRSLNALIAIGSLLGGILVWAVCIALAAVTENSITISRYAARRTG